MKTMQTCAVVTKCVFLLGIRIELCGYIAVPKLASIVVDHRGFVGCARKIVTEINIHGKGVTE